MAGVDSYLRVPVALPSGVSADPADEYLISGNNAFRWEI